MPQFQSKLFNWIERSLPVKLGRKARQVLNKLTVELAEKLSQVIEDIEEKTTTHQVQNSLKKLLQPAKALVKFMAQQGKITTHPEPSQTEITKQQPLTKSSDDPQEHQKFGELNELIIRAIAYFRKKKRTLPAPALPSTKTERMVIYSSMEAEPAVSWLDAIQPPVLSSNDHNDQLMVIEKEIEKWEADLDDYCMRAWIETQATFLGYADSPIIKFLMWLDRIILKIEKWFMALWQKLVDFWYSKFTKV